MVTSNEIPYEGLASCYWQLGDYKKAIKTLQDYEDEKPDVLDRESLYALYAHNYYGLGSYKSAYEYQSKYIEEIKSITKGCDLAVEYSNLSEIAKKINDINAMEEAIKAALEICEDNWFVLNNLCELYLYKKDYKKALNEIEKAKLISAGHPMIYITMGDLKREIGKDNEALDHYFQAIINDSTIADPYRKIALIFKSQGNGDFIEYYQKAAHLGDKDAKIWIMRNNRLIKKTQE